MQRFLCFAVLLVLVVASSVARGAEVEVKDDAKDSIQRAVVKVFAIQRFPNLLKPWAAQAPREISGSGIVIDGQRIVTNAHVVAFAGQIEVQPFESSRRYPATVTSLSMGMDLAVLEVKDKAFFEASGKGLEINTKLPALKDAVSVYGYPVGGDALAITKGTITRIEYDDYSERQAGLKLEISASISSGNSGGPAVIDNKVVGLVFEVSKENGSIGYAIPSEEIAAFLEHGKATPYEGKPRMAEGMFSLENEARRAKFGLTEKVSGVLIGDPAEEVRNNPLKRDDIITQIGKYHVDNKGMIDYDGKLRTLFLYAVPKVAVNGHVPLTLLRDGKTLQVDYPVAALAGEYLIPYMSSNQPTYSVWGPMCFSPATIELIGGLYPYLSARWVVRRSPLVTRSGKLVDFPGEQLVVVTGMLPHKVSKGYSNPAGQVVHKVNGTVIKNMRHLVETLRDVKDRYVEFEFADKGVEKLVFDRQEVEAATEDILSDNGIRQPQSTDLRSAAK